MRAVAVLMLAAALAGCGAFSEDAPPLPGERIPVRQAAREPVMNPAEAQALADLGTERPLEAWPQRNALPSRAPGHIAGPSGLNLAWRTGIGTGSGSSSVITSAPVVEGGRVFVLDAASRVSAVDAAGGRLLWRASVVPEGQGERDGFGGGLAVSDGRLIVSTGFGEVVALSVADGAQIWRQGVGAPMRAAPVVDEGVVVVVTRDNSAFGLRLESGEVLWRLPGTGQIAPGLLQGASPAAAGGLSVLPFSSGELVAVRTTSGRTVWADTLAAGRRGLARSAISDVSGDPVIAGVGVFASNSSGQMVAIDGRTGRRGWLRTMGSNNPVWVAGQTLFAIDDTARLMRLAASTGQTIWENALPEYEDEDRDTAIAYGGPVVAGGRVYVTSSDDALLVFDPATGAEVQRVALPGGSSTGPVIANGTLYVLSDSGDLLAYR